MSLEGIDLKKEFGTYDLFRARREKPLLLSEEEIRRILAVAISQKWKLLDLQSLSLTSIPQELWQLKYLQRLFLHYNNLTKIPAELKRLRKLGELCLVKNHIKFIPIEIVQLENLQILNLSSNELSFIPLEIVKLRYLKTLWLYDNQLTSFPRDFGRMKYLEALGLHGNQLTSIPKEIGLLKNLQELRINSNIIEAIPSELGQLKKLRSLSIDDNRIGSIPPELGQLDNLGLLNISSNLLTSIPAELGHLCNLNWFSLTHNQLTTIPAEFGNLTKLEILDLSHNQLTHIPAEFGNLTKLKKLDLSQNQLTTVPPELAMLSELKELKLDDNPLTSPPPEVVKQGTEAILEYLRDLTIEKEQVWVSKLLMVGEGGVGKTSLVHNLRHEKWNPQEDTTRGVEIHDVPISHPVLPDVTMHLNAWDFGGQEIYHATHQFFLTNRSLFLLIWNARLGYEQGKIPYWLDTIQARAPESPVIIVATYTDQRDADIPLADLKQKYPQIVGHFSVSNASGAGIEELEKAIQETAAKLPLMGEYWPKTWLSAATDIRLSTCRYIKPSQFSQMVGNHGLSSDKAAILGRMMHDLGDILYYEDDPTVNDIVILKPQWVTHYISRILDSEKVADGLGILKKDLMKELWSDLDETLHEPFLRLMEKFDLSYQTLADPDVSIIVERLRFDPPKEHTELWETVAGTPEISMRYDIGSTVPAGVPTYFIARSHRFTTYNHWRRGALFADGSDRKHYGLIRSDPDSRYLELSVRGPIPQSFFALLRDGLELTLNRFPGLPIKRSLPCPGHGGRPCPYRFDLKTLERAIERNPPAETVQCGESLENVSVTEVLFGLHWKTESLVLERISQLETHMEDQFAGMRELTQRGFTRQFLIEQSRLESECPNTFVMYPQDQKAWSKIILGRKVKLHLFCQQPGEWHPTNKSGEYTLEESPEWYAKISPVVSQVVKVLKYAKPVLGPLADISIPNYEETLKNWVELSEGLIGLTASPQEDFDESIMSERIPSTPGIQQHSGVALRELRTVLDKHDPKHVWGGLQKVLTPEGDYLWLCEEHAKQYRR